MIFIMIQEKLLSILLELFLTIVNLYLSLIQTVFQVFDQTHYHRDAFVNYIRIAIRVLCDYLNAIPRCVYVHFCHERYLCQLGMEGVGDLKDTGSLVWKQISPEGNMVNAMPAQRVTGFEGNVSGNPAHLAIASTSILKLWQKLSALPDFSFDETVFVDFGCGTGFAVLSAMTQPFKKVIGVELNERSAKLGQYNLRHFQESKQTRIPIKCTDASIIQMDMNEFNFTNYLQDKDNTSNSKTTKPTTKNPPLPTLLLYMYEPLWTLPKDSAHHIYHRILTKTSKCGTTVLLAYFHCGIYSGDALPALEGLHAELLQHWRYDSLNFGAGGEFFLYKL